MTYYAIKHVTNGTYHHQDSNTTWQFVPDLYSTPDQADTVRRALKLNGDGVVVEVTCDIKPVKGWVKYSMCQLLCRKEYQCDGIRTRRIHAALTAGTLRVSGDGWEVLE